MADGKHISDEALLDELDYVLQKHTQASKGNRSHADFRFGNQLEGLESYAIPKGHLPDVKERLLAVNTEIHPHGYMRFQGSYGRGKGKNKVEILESGRINVNGEGDGSRFLEISEEAPRRRYKLIKIKKGGKDSWIIVGLPPGGGEVKAAAEKDYNFIPGRFLDSRTEKPLSGLCIIQAVSSKALQKGLGGRTGLPAGLGMLFLNCRTFWMKDVPFDLDLVRLDRNFTVTEIQRMKGSFMNLHLPTYYPDRPKSVHALEVPAGYCEAKGIKVGDLLRVKKGA